MARCLLRIKASAQKAMDALDARPFARIDRKIMGWAESPRPRACKKLKGGEREWRIRVGDYRIVYTIDGPNRFVEITRIRHRHEAYD